MSRIRNIAMNAAVVLGTVAIIVVALELVVVPIVDDGMQYDLEMWRYARHLKMVSSDPELGHVHRPDARAWLMGVDVQTNSLGLRDRDIPPKKRPGAVRILMLGDSTTFGWGVPAELTMARRLERTLRESGLDAEVINTGVGNYNTRMEVAYFLGAGRRLDPDIVVLNYFINDAEPIPSYDKGLLERYSKSYVYFSARWDSAVRRVGRGAARQADWKTYYRGLYDEQVNPGGWSGTVSAIERLAKYCRDNGIKLLLNNIPELRELRPYPFEEVSAKLLSTAQRIGIDYVDLLVGIRDEPPASLWVTAPDPHPNARAMELFAAALLEPLRMLAAGVVEGQGTTR